MPDSRNVEKDFEEEEEQFRIPDNLFDIAMENSFDAFMITTAQPGYPIVFINKAFSEITGYTLQECLKKSPAFLQGPKTDPEVLKRLNENIRAGEKFHGETVNYRKDGSEFVMEWRVLPYKNAAGAITHYFAIQRDVTHIRDLQRTQAVIINEIVNNNQKRKR